MKVRAQDVKAQEVPALEVKEPEPKPIPVMKLMDPFIKVEDVSRHYRPLFGLRLIFECPYGPSHPMDTKESEHKTAAHQGPTKMPGYCECCRCIYPDLEEVLHFLTDINVSSVGENTNEDLYSQMHISFLCLHIGAS
ncbi:protein DBF4 homolog A-like isoform X2 [Pseudophryne corroboree]|uniref:protein DBF4 homolog A-like isoform X2 n=1 Tax=Pseudophryne corroboree TaxID=495146 RepID=UPI00308211D9